MARRMTYQPDDPNDLQSYLQQALTDDGTAGNRDAGGDVNTTMPVGPPSPMPKEPLAPGSSPQSQFAYKTSGMEPDAQLGAAYKSFLGRDAGPGEIASHYGNPGGLLGRITAVAESPEAKARQSQSPTQAGPISAGPQMSTAPQAPQTSAPGGLPQRGMVGQLTGYPDELGRSMKHVFGALASRYGNNRGSLAQLANDPEFKQWFPNARVVDDDEIDFGGQLSDFDNGVPVGLVDVMRGGDDAWQWIDQNYVNDQGGGNTSPDLTAALSGLGGSSILDQIRDELAAVINGKPSPTNQQNLQSLLGGGQ